MKLPCARMVVRVPTIDPASQKNDGLVMLSVPLPPMPPPDNASELVLNVHVPSHEMPDVPRSSSPEPCATAPLRNVPAAEFSLRPPGTTLNVPLFVKRTLLRDEPPAKFIVPSFTTLTAP